MSMISVCFNDLYSFLSDICVLMPIFAMSMIPTTGEAMLPSSLCPVYERLYPLRMATRSDGSMSDDMYQ